jgi:hypothetical protein
MNGRALLREICDAAARLPPHDTHYDNVPADPADYDIDDIPFPQENTPEQGVSKLLAVWGSGVRVPLAPPETQVRPGLAPGLTCFF